MDSTRCALLCVALLTTGCALDVSPSGAELRRATATLPDAIPLTGPRCDDRRPPPETPSRGGQPCDRHAACASGLCVPTPSGTFVCAGAGGNCLGVEALGFGAHVVAMADCTGVNLHTVCIPSDAGSASCAALGGCYMSERCADDADCRYGECVVELGEDEGFCARFRPTDGCPMRHAVGSVSGPEGTWSACVPAPAGCELSTCAVVEVERGDNASCVRLESGPGEVYCHGYDTAGQLGLGTPKGEWASHRVEVPRDPVLRQPPLGAPVPLDDVVDLELSFNYACALRGDGSVWCWGTLTPPLFGGDPPSTASLARRVSPEVLTDVTAISVGAMHACAIQAGTVYCWGRGSSGELGVAPEHCAVGDRDCALDDSPVAVPVAGVGGAVEVTTPWQSTCARLAGGEVTCWGNAAFLGGGGVDAYAPPAVLDLPAPATHVRDRCASLDDGSLVCWYAGIEVLPVGDVADFSLGSSGLITVDSGGAPHVYDPSTFEHRTPARHDVGGTVPITEALSIVSAAGGMCLVDELRTVRCGRPHADDEGEVAFSTQFFPGLGVY